MYSPTVIEFVADDARYLKWIAENPQAFVVNTTRTKTKSYRVLHLATCRMIGTRNVRPGGFTERAYIKICSPEVASLQRHLGSISGSCKTCGAPRV